MMERDMTRKDMMRKDIVQIRRGILIKHRGTMLSSSDGQGRQVAAGENTTGE